MHGGGEVTVIINPNHPDVKDAKEQYDLVLICIDIDANTYLGGTLRIGWEQAMTFWRGYLTRNKNIAFASFGDPYKLYDYPFAETYINMYSNVKSSQRTFIKALFGEIEPLGKSPVEFDGYFKREI